ncbi:zinc finger, CCHC-type containing protein [Tanacetum coccineum]
MPAGRKISEHIDEFNKIVLDLANIEVKFEDEDLALLLLTFLPASYKHFVDTLLYGREALTLEDVMTTLYSKEIKERSLTMEDVLATLNSKELKKRTKGTKEETGDGLYVRRRSDHSGKAHSGESSRFKLRGGTSKLKCFICHSEGHLKRDCPIKKSSGFIKKGKRDQDYDSSDDKGNTYFGKALVVVGNDEMTELVMDQLDDNRTYTIKGTGKVKIQLHDGSSFVLKDVRYVPGLRRSLILLGVHGVQVKKRVWFEVELQRAQGNREAEIFQVSNDDTAVAQRRLEDKKLEEKTNTDCLVKEQEKVHLGIKVGANITVTGVPGQEGAEGNVAEKKKVKE